MSEIKVAFVGLGAMGMPMAGHLARAGLLTAVWNRSAAKARTAAEQFSVAAPDQLVDVASLANVIVLCVSADSDVLAVVNALVPNLKPGSVIVDHSTVSSVTARAAREIALAHGCEFIDAPVSGGEKLGLDPAALLPTLGAGAAGNWFLEKRGATMLHNEFSVGFKLALLHKDLSIVRGLAEQAGVSQRVIDQSIADYAELMAMGHGDEDISALIRLKREASA